MRICSVILVIKQKTRERRESTAEQNRDKHHTTLQKKLSQLPAVDMQHAPAKLPSKLHLSAYVDLLAQSLCSMHSHCESKIG